MTRKENIALWISVVGTITTVTLGFLGYFGVTPSFLAPYAWVFWIILGVFIVIVVIALVTRYKKQVKEQFIKKYYEKLERNVKEELETEAKIKNLTYLQKNPSIIPWITPAISQNIMNGLPPITYVANLGGMIPRTEKHFTMVGNIDQHKNYVLEIPLDEAKILADKMTELSHNTRYRKNKLLFYLTH